MSWVVRCSTGTGSRRAFLAAGALAACGLAGRPARAEDGENGIDLSASAADPSGQRPIRSELPGLPRALAPLWLRVRSELERLGPAIVHRDSAAIADFGAPSREPRFHLFDLQAGTVRSYLVAHGRGSDPQHSGWVRRFSNAVGSNASSEGAYRTGELYEGRFGRSMRLVGLDASNSNAHPRAIVVHSADYVDEDIARVRGKLGLSDGCFVFSDDDVHAVLDALGPDRLLLAGRFQPAAAGMLNAPGRS